MADSLEPGWFQITLKVFLVREGEDGDEMLILRDAARQSGDLPGGRLAVSELHDPWESALRREIAEELGDDLRYELAPDPLFHFSHVVENGNHPAVGFTYHAEYRGGDPRLSDEHDWMEWVSIENYSPEPFFRAHMAEAVKLFQTEYA